MMGFDQGGPGTGQWIVMCVVMLVLVGAVAALAYWAGLRAGRTD